MLLGCVHPLAVYRFIYCRYNNIYEERLLPLLPSVTESQVRTKAVPRPTHVTSLDPALQPSQVMAMPLGSLVSNATPTGATRGPPPGMPAGMAEGIPGQPTGAGDTGARRRKRRRRR